MEQENHALLGAINRAIVQFRGYYSRWAAVHGISYNELLVLYTLREQGYCTQKQICDRYLLPRQTINHVMLDLRARGLLALSPDHCTGREKAFALTSRGREYAAPLLASLDKIEEQAIRRFGGQRMHEMAQTLLDYDSALQSAMEQDQ